MLYGMSLECLLKALLIAKGASLINGAGELRGNYRHHKLLTYAHEAGISLEEKDRELFVRLTRAVQEGKYPMGTKPKASIAELATGMSIPSDHHRICRIATEIEDSLRALGMTSYRRRNLSKV
jgi:hypothetical protein